MEDTPSPLRVVYMGDSITFGQYVGGDVRWTALVDRRLRERFPDLPIETFNRGISGETTRQGLERFPADVQAIAPAVATIHFGLNDCNCWETERGLPRVSEAAYEANLREMIHRARHFGAHQVVMMTAHRTLRRDPLPSGEIYEDASSRYSEIVRRVAGDTEAVLCDIRAAFDGFDDETLAEYLLPSPDLLHLSVSGNSAYADLIWPTVEAAVLATTEENR